MRKRSMIGAAGALAVALMAAAPGTASAEVFVDEGSAFGNVTVETPAPFTEGVLVAWGGAFGNVTIETPAAPSSDGVVLVPKGGAFGDVTVEKLIEPASNPAQESSPDTSMMSECHEGACPAQVLGATDPVAGDMFGVGIHSTGSQQALRLGVLEETSVSF